jgi:YVTN family beta-propeller protein
VYLQPLPQDAGRLTFALASVSAVSGDGSEYPLTVSLGVITREDAARQRLLASGRLPAGSYAGFLVRIKRAALRNDGGDVTLAVPDAPVRLDAPFAVAGQQSPVLWVALKVLESVSSESGFSPVFSVVMPPKPLTDHVGLVSNSGSSTITVFDKNLAQAVSVIETCAGPAGMALDQRRRRVYVACARDDEIQSIDVATGEILERSRLSPGDRPREVALTPDGLTLLAVGTGSNTVSFFDAVTLNRDERLTVGSGPNAILIEPAGRRAFVFNTLSSSVSIIDIPSRSVVATLSTEAAPLRGQFNGRGDRLYVIHERSPYMTVVDPRQLNIVTRVRLRIGVSAITLDSVRGLVCIAASNDTGVEFYDPNALMPLYSMRTRAGVSYLTIDAEDNTLYVVSPETRSVAVGRLADRKVVAEIDVGDRPYWVAVMGEK